MAENASGWDLTGHKGTAAGGRPWELRSTPGRTRQFSHTHADSHSKGLLILTSKSIPQGGWQIGRPAALQNTASPGLNPPNFHKAHLMSITRQWRQRMAAVDSALWPLLTCKIVIGFL